MCPLCQKGGNKHTLQIYPAEIIYVDIYIGKCEACILSMIAHCADMLAHK